MRYFTPNVSAPSVSYDKSHDYYLKTKLKVLKISICTKVIKNCSYEKSHKKSKKNCRLIKEKIYMRLLVRTSSLITKTNSKLSYETSLTQGESHKKKDFNFFSMRFLEPT